MIAGTFSYLTNDFHVTAGTVGSSFSSGLPKVHGKINFPNKFANTMFPSVQTALGALKSKGGGILKNMDPN